MIKPRFWLFLTSLFLVNNIPDANAQTGRNNESLSNLVVPVCDSTGIGAIIPYASGDPMGMSTDDNGNPALVALLGFGSSVDGVPLSGGQIDLTGGAGQNLAYAFSVPSDGVITAISAYFSTATPIALLTNTTVTIKAQLYESTTPDNIFTPIPGAQVILSPTITTGVLPAGSVSHGVVTGLNIPVTSETRLLMVYSISATGASVDQILILGYAGGSVAFTAS